jgi:predicted GIY-YIG superfamily endonuclease
MKVKTPREDMKDVVYEVPCMDCDTSYNIGETARDLHKRIVEHKAAVRRKDDKNGIALHANGHNHHVDWEGAKVLEQEPRYWRRRILEAIHIQRRRKTSNLDCGLALNAIWTPFLE